MAWSDAARAAAAEARRRNVKDVSVRISGFGSGIYAAVKRNSVVAAKKFNVGQAEKYLREAKRSKSPEMIAYAQRLLDIEKAK